jgi:hypothetical protein
MADRVVIFSPWPLNSLGYQALKYAAGANKRSHKVANQNKTYLVRGDQGLDPLGDLTPTDRLYILGHGVPGIPHGLSTPAIRGDDDLTWDKVQALDARVRGRYVAVPEPHVLADVPPEKMHCGLTPRGLVNTLLRCGLDDNFVDVRLYNCRLGDGNFSNFGVQFTELLRKDFKSAKVTAYTCYLDYWGGVEHSGRKMGTMDENADSQAAHNFKVEIVT